ncbi:MAG TPA: hypothetical protein DCL77_19390, partial [Prolixibacteraceae bacterium]|nr:hypothetical protein [Prolixibacteraceae bacterium]
MDNCSGIVTGTTNTIFPITTQGTTKVTWSFDDGNGNVTTALQNVIVDDITPPITPVLADINVGECSGTPSVPTTTDNCSGIVTGTTLTQFPITRQGITVVIWSFDDGNGNVTTASQNVIVDDITKPVMPTLADVTVECSTTPNIPTTIDNCSGIITGTTSTHFPITRQGTTVVTWNFDDGNGNVTTASQNVIVDDKTPPVITGTIPSMTVEGCTAEDVIPAVKTVSELEMLGLSISDACTADLSLLVTSSDTSIGTLPVTVTRTYIITDASKNATAYSYSILIVDTQIPTIICATPADSYPNSIPGKDLDPSFSDNCKIASITNSYNNSNSLKDAEFPLGTTIVTWTVTDASGNKATCSNKVVITDTRSPVIICATPQASYEADNGVCTYKISGTTLDPTIEDNNSSVDIENNFNNSSSLKDAEFPIGITNVLWTVTEKNGNTTTCNQTISVKDTQNPMISCPSNINGIVDQGKCTASGLVLGMPITEDNCSIASVSNNAPDIYLPGITIVTWTVIDGSGNMSSCSQTVTVNGFPEAVDDIVSINEDDQSSGNVMINDLGICDLPVFLKAHTEPVNGTLTILSDGSYTYIPAPNYHGMDSFTYQICDANGDCSTASVTITIKSVNDLPLAVSDEENLQVDGTLEGSVGKNDILSGDGENVWNLLNPPSYGIILFNTDGTFSYTPNTNYIGIDSFTYKLCDLDGDCSEEKMTVHIQDVLLPNQILTPNGDGDNDTFIIKGIELYSNNRLTMYNRWGNIVYQRNNYQNEWDGNSNVNRLGSKSLPIGTYYYLIDYGKNRHKT